MDYDEYYELEYQNYYFHEFQDCRISMDKEKERKGNISERAGRQGSVLSSRRSVKDPTPTTFKLLKEAAIENGDIYTNGNGSAFRRSWSERHRNGVLQASREHENGDSSLPPNLDREIDPSQNILHPDITNSLNDSIQDNKKTPGSCWRNLHKELSDGQDSSSATVLQSPPNSSLVLPEEFSEQPNATSPCGANPTVYLFPTTPTFQPSDDFTSPNSKAARKFVAWREGDSGSFEMTPNSSPGAGSPLLWVFHDNPQLSTQLQGLLMSERQLQVSALLEVRMPEGRTKLVLGDISFAGDLENAPHSRVKRCPRGGQCMEMSRLLSWELLLAKKGDTNNEAPTRDRDEITDILLSAETAKLLVRGRSHQTPGSTNTLETVESCFRNTQAKIDVMLHPTRDGNWFPYWESKRRLAPQFRSSGIGYLRLADDTGQHGLSFLSVDGGRSFLSNHGFHHQTNLALAEPQLHDQISPRRKSFALDAEADLATKLARLTDRAVASQERVRLVLELEDCLARLVLENDSKENQACSAVFKALQVCLSELSPNAHMVKASCKCLLGIVHLMDAGTLQTHETWPALADSLIHLLKSSNKVIATEISSLLGSLHSNGHLRLGSMATILANQLGVDADECGEATPKKKSVPPSVVQILQWCLTCLNKEFEEDSMKMEDIASYAKIYLSLCDHRQANVRKVATEGLSTIVLQYSIKEGLVFEGDQCPEISIVSGLKQTNPKLYLQLESFIKSQKANQKS